MKDKKKDEEVEKLEELLDGLKDVPVDTIPVKEPVKSETVQELTTELENTDELFDEVSKRICDVGETKNGIARIKRLRGYRAENEKKKKEIVCSVFEGLHKSVRLAVGSLYEFGSIPPENVESVSLKICKIVFTEMVNMGVLPSTDVTHKVLSGVDDLRERMKNYIIKNDKGLGLSRCQILIGIGRNHKTYFEVADYVLNRLLSEGFCFQRGRRYFITKGGKKMAEEPVRGVSTGAPDMKDDVLSYIKEHPGRNRLEIRKTFAKPDDVIKGILGTLVEDKKITIVGYRYYPADN